MTRRLFLRPKAEVAIAIAFNEWHLRSPERAHVLLAEVDEALDKIGAYPLAYAQNALRVRRINLNRFAYAFYFRVEEAVDSQTGVPFQRIVVLSFFHQRQNPASLLTDDDL